MLSRPSYTRCYYVLDEGRRTGLDDWIYLRSKLGRNIRLCVFSDSNLGDHHGENKLVSLTPTMKPTG